MTDVHGSQTPVVDVRLKGWDVDAAAAGPVLTITGENGETIILRLAPEDLPELAAGLLRLADHLRLRPPCGAG